VDLEGAKGFTPARTELEYITHKAVASLSIAHTHVIHLVVHDGSCLRRSRGEAGTMSGITTARALECTVVSSSLPPSSGTSTRMSCKHSSINSKSVAIRYAKETMKLGTANRWSIKLQMQSGNLGQGPLHGLGFRLHATGQSQVNRCGSRSSPGGGQCVHLQAETAQPHMGAVS